MKLGEIKKSLSGNVRKISHSLTPSTPDGILLQAYRACPSDNTGKDDCNHRNAARGKSEFRVGCPAEDVSSHDHLVGSVHCAVSLQHLIRERHDICVGGRLRSCPQQSLHANIFLTRTVGLAENSVGDSSGARDPRKAVNKHWRGRVFCKPQNLSHVVPRCRPLPRSRYGDVIELGNVQAVITKATPQIFHGFICVRGEDIPDGNDGFGVALDLLFKLMEPADLDFYRLLH